MDSGLRDAGIVQGYRVQEQYRCSTGSGEVQEYRLTCAVAV